MLFGFSISDWILFLPWVSKPVFLELRWLLENQLFCADFGSRKMWDNFSFWPNCIQEGLLLSRHPVALVLCKLLKFISLDSQWSDIGLPPVGLFVRALLGNQDSKDKFWAWSAMGHPQHWVQMETHPSLLHGSCALVIPGSTPFCQRKGFGDIYVLKYDTQNSEL